VVRIFGNGGQEMHPMRLIVGLGNPGERYERTPHNLGFLVIDELSRQLNISLRRPEAQSLLGIGRSGENELLLAKPQTYMNLSGQAVRRLFEQWELAPRDLIVVVDDLDLPWGQIRIRERGSAGTHNGMCSIVEEIGSTEFVRVRLGIQPDHPIEDAAQYVLAPIEKRLTNTVEDLVVQGARAVLVIVQEGAVPAMNHFNGSTTSPADRGTDLERL
jgi:PTH1 family peptidyl-tRNA hydrolase